MALFGFGKKKGILDLTEKYKKQQEKLAQIQFDSQETPEQSSTGGALSFLGNLASGSASNTETGSQSEDYVSNETDDKRKKLAKRLIDMTAKIEDLSNQIYHLQQRIEVLERKSGVNSRFE